MMTSVSKRLVFLLVPLLALAGCAGNPIHDDELTYEPSMPLPPTPLEELHGSLYQEDKSMVLFEDVRARRVGDIITIVLTEKMNASKSAKTETSKDSEVSVPNPTIFGRNPSFNLPGKSNLDLSLAMELESAQAFAGEGDSEMSNALSGEVTVTVAKVLSNGNLIVRGEKRLTINQGNEYVRISGIVRPSDIRPDNTVLSTLVADARITYTGDGDVADSSRMGVVSRFFNKWWIF